MPYDVTKDKGRTPDVASQPATKAVAVTPSDSTDLTTYAKAIYVGGAGNIAVIMKYNSADTGVTFNGVTAGTVLPIQVRRVLATGTTATNIIALSE